VRGASGRISAGARADDGGFLDAGRLVAEGLGRSRFDEEPARALQNTTLCLVATDAPLDRVALEQLARAAGAALFRRITPCGTTFDGDVVFATCPMMEPTRDPAVALQAEALAVRALEEAIERAVRLARGRDGVPGLADGGAR
jgi:D-aminopeptidase